MTQVSRRLMNRDIEKRTFQVFEKTIADLKDPRLVKNYIADLLTPTEKIMLSKRLAIAVLLIKGHDYRSICDVLKVSSTTILAVVRRQLIGGEGLRVAVEKILKDEETEKLFAQIETAILKALVPSRRVKSQIEGEYRKRLRQIANRVV